MRSPFACQVGLPSLARRLYPVPVTDQDIRDYFKAFGAQGGRQRAKNMTAKARSASASKAAKIMWKKRKAEQKRKAS